jgi:hypothetical protein
MQGLKTLSPVTASGLIPFRQHHFGASDEDVLLIDLASLCSKEREAGRSFGTLCDFCNALSFFESHRNPALICIAMSPDDNKRGAS